MKWLKSICFLVSILPCSSFAMDLFPKENTQPSAHKNSVHNSQKKFHKKNGKRKIGECNFINTEEDKENKQKEGIHIEEKSFKRRKLSNAFQGNLNENRKHFLKEEIKNILENVEDAHKGADWVKVYNTFVAFNSCKYKEGEWKCIGQRLKAYKWPSQNTWKEVVGGHLFFPKETIEWENNYFETYHLRRIDMLWTFAVGAKLNHALSKYYLVRMLDKIRSDYTDADRPEFFKKLYKQSFEDLKKSADNPDACYIIGKNYVSYPYLSTTYVDDKKEKDIPPCEKAIQWHQQGRDLKNRFEILEVKDAARALYLSPTKDEYLELAREGYISAYMNALDLTKDSEERKKIKTEALEKGYKYLLFDPKNRSKKELEKARKSYVNAGTNKVSKAYIMLGTTYVGDIDSQFKMDRINLKKVAPEDIQKAIESFTLAGKLNNPEGWEYLSILYQELYDQDVINTEEYREKIVSSLEEGVRLGSAACYHKSYHYLSKEIFNSFIKNYGYPPQMELRYNIKAFLDKKY